MASAQKNLLPSVGPQGQLSLSTGWVQTLPPQDQQIFRAKYGETRFCRMDDAQIGRWGNALLIKIAVITGWVLPTDEMLNVLVDQFKKKLTESYANCNTEEVEYAFRNFASYVKDWGKQINLNMIDEVMQPYLLRRREQSFVEEQAAPPLLLESKKEDMGEEAMREWLDTEVQYIKTGKPFELIPLELYDFLDKRGEIICPIEEKYEYLAKAAAWRQGELQKEAERRSSVENMRAIEQFRKMREKGCIQGDEAERVKNLAKKLLFYDLVLKNY